MIIYFLQEFAMKWLVSFDEELELCVNKDIFGTANW